MSFEKFAFECLSKETEGQLRFVVGLSTRKRKHEYVYELLLSPRKAVSEMNQGRNYPVLGQHLVEAGFSLFVLQYLVFLLFFAQVAFLDSYLSYQT